MIPETIEDVMALPYGRIQRSRGSLPECAGVYFVIDPAMSIVYIGTSQNIGKRFFGGHSYRQEFNARKCNRVAWIAVPQDKHERYRIELLLIRRFMPEMSVQAIAAKIREREDLRARERRLEKISPIIFVSPLACAYALDLDFYSEAETK